MNLDLIKKSGIHQKGELEAILGVTRMSLYKYNKGTAKPRKAVADKIHKLELIVTRLLEKSILPIDASIDIDKRAQLINKIKDILNA
jgi:predicted transcriptional regulator